MKKTHNMKFMSVLEIYNTVRFNTDVTDINFSTPTPFNHNDNYPSWKR